MADFVRLSQSRSYENLSYCPNVIAYLKAMVLYVELHQLRQRLCIGTGTVSKMLSNWKQRGYIVLDLASTPTNLDDEVYRKTEKYLKRWNVFAIKQVRSFSGSVSSVSGVQFL